MASHWFRRYKILIFILLVSTVVGIGIMALTESGIHDPYNRTVGPKKVLALMIQADITKITTCFCSPDREVRISRDDGLSTAASIYDRGGSGPRPGIVLIHGNTSLGQKLAMYKVLATKLADNGYVVLTLDLPGFGESDDPFKLGTVGALDEVKIVTVAVQYLIEKRNVDKENLSIIGHSRGTVAALDAGLTMDEIKNIILIGPVRRLRERFANPKNRKYFWRRTQETHRFVYGTPIPDWYTADIWAEEVGQLAMENYMEYFSKGGHKPLMLVDGEREEQRDKLYLERYYSALAEPKKLVRLRQSDHYCNTAQSIGLILYDKGVMDQLVHEITQWLGNGVPQELKNTENAERQR